MARLLRPAVAAAAVTSLLAFGAGCGSTSKAAVPPTTLAPAPTSVVGRSTTTTVAPATTGTTTGGATTTATGATTTTGPSAPACATDGLGLAVGGPTDPGAGSVTYPITFANRGTVACSLQGFPGVSAVDAAGQQIGQPASRTSQSAPTVVIGPGGVATALLRVAQAANFDPVTCGTATPSAGLKVFPPAQTASATVAAVITVCSGAAVQLQINPITS